MELSSEQLLQQQAVMAALRTAAGIARASHQQHRLRKSRYRDRTNPQAQSIGFDATSGSDLIQLADGSITQAASLTNGVRGTGSTVQLHQGMGRVAVDQMPAVRKQLQLTQKIKPAPFPFKVLFSITDYLNNTIKYYLGGDRPQPLLVATFDTTINQNRGAYIVNTGSGKNDWIITIRNYSYINGGTETTYTFGKTLGTITQAHNDPQAFTDYKGGGIWISPYVRPYIEKIETVNFLGTGFGINYQRSGYYQVTVPPFLSANGNYNHIGIGTTFCPNNDPNYPSNGTYAGPYTETENYTAEYKSFLLNGGQFSTLQGQVVYTGGATVNTTCIDSVYQGSTNLTYQCDLFLSKLIQGEYTETFQGGGDNHTNYSTHPGGYTSITNTYYNSAIKNESSLILDAKGHICVSQLLLYSQKHISHSVGEINNTEGTQFVKFFLNTNQLYEQELNNEAGFSFESPTQLIINESTVYLTIDNLQFTVPTQIVYSTHSQQSNNTFNTTYTPANFSLVGTSIIVSQYANVERTSCWTASGVIVNETVITYQADTYVVGAIDIQITKVENTSFDEFASYTGTIHSDNGSILPLVLGNNNSIVYHSALIGKYDRLLNFDRGYKHTNFLKTKFFFSRNPYEFFDKSGENFAEVWELKPNANGKLDAVKIGIKKGKIYSLGAPANYATDPDKFYQIEGISYYPS